MPADSLCAVGCAGVGGEGSVDGGLVEGIAVEAGDAAEGHGGGVQVGEEVWVFGFEGGEGGEEGHPCVFALAFEAVESLDLDRVVVEGVVGVGEEELGGVVVCEAEGAVGVGAVGGDVEGGVGAADGVDEGAAEEGFEDEGVEVVGVGALGLERGSKLVTVPALASHGQV